MACQPIVNRELTDNIFWVVWHYLSDICINKQTTSRTDNKQNKQTLKKIIVISLLALCSIAAQAQNDAASGSQTANLNLSDAIDISFVSSTTVQNIEFNSLNDLINGVETAEHELRVRSNKKFKVTVKPSSRNFTYSGSYVLNTLLRVSNVMKIAVTDNNTGGTQPFFAQLTGWQSFSYFGWPTTLLNNCDAGGNQTFKVKYKATPGVNAVAGTYTVDMVYTATQL